MKVRVWQYDVTPEHRPEFERVYGPQGAWAELFHRSPDYLGTELFASMTEPGRYVTVDRFANDAGWPAFLDANASAYSALDRVNRGLHVAETELA